MAERLTKSDVQKIEAEIEHRTLDLRPQLIEAVKEARAQGDLSENFEYYAAKREKNINESRIRYLERMLKTAVVVDETANDDEVGINNTVTVYIPEDDAEETYKLVTSIRSDALKGLISIESPLGKAIRGAKVGDKRMVHVSPEYSYEIEIRSIDKSTGDDGDRIRQF